MDEAQEKRARARAAEAIDDSGELRYARAGRGVRSKKTGKWAPEADAPPLRPAS